MSHSIACIYCGSQISADSSYDCCRDCRNYYRRTLRVGSFECRNRCGTMLQADHPYAVCLDCIAKWGDEPSQCEACYEPLPAGSYELCDACDGEECGPDEFGDGGIFEQVQEDMQAAIFGDPVECIDLSECIDLHDVSGREVNTLPPSGWLRECSDCGGVGECKPSCAIDRQAAYDAALREWAEGDPMFAGLA